MSGSDCAVMSKLTHTPVTASASYLTMRHLIEDAPKAPDIACPTQLDDWRLPSSGGIESSLSCILESFRAHVVHCPELKNKTIYLFSVYIQIDGGRQLARSFMAQI